MMKQLLLGGTALAGIAALSLPAAAGTVGSGDNMSVKLSGEYRFNIALLDQDVTNGFGRGYSFKGDEAEVKVSASNTADNGIRYGVDIELNANTDDGSAADEAFAFIESDAWGRVEMGDQDDAVDRMNVQAFHVMVGRAGYDGDIGDFVNFGTGRAIASSDVDETSDATKITYFSPRFAGFQVGASLTPDDGSNGLSATETDNDGDYENVIGAGINYKGDFDQVGIILSAVGEWGDSETASGAATEGDLETYAFGANLSFAGFGFGASYADFGEKGRSQAQIALGQDSGSYWTAAVSYKTGPWGASLGYYDSEVDNGTGGGGDTTVEMIMFDGAYTVAPGWVTSLGVYLVEADNINATAVNVDQDATLVLFTNNFKF